MSKLKIRAASGGSDEVIAGRASSALRRFAKPGALTLLALAYAVWMGFCILGAFSLLRINSPSIWLGREESVATLLLVMVWAAAALLMLGAIGLERSQKLRPPNGNRRIVSLDGWAPKLVVLAVLTVAAGTMIFILEPISAYIAVPIIFLAWLAVALLTLVLIALERFEKLRLASLGDRVVALDGWGPKLVGSAVLMVVGAVMIFTRLGVIVALAVAALMLVLLLVSAWRHQSTGMAFAVLTVFVLSILAFNALFHVASILTTPMHLLALGIFLLVQRNHLQRELARLRRLVRWGLILSAALIAVHAVVLVLDIVFKGAYYGVPIPFTALSMGILLLLLPRQDRRALFARVMRIRVVALAARVFLGRPRTGTTSYSDAGVTATDAGGSEIAR